MKNFVSVENLRHHNVDFTAEQIPANPVFNSYEGEVFVYENRRPVSRDRIMWAVQQGYINDFDLKVLALIAAFAPACMTSKTLKELFWMVGEELGCQEQRLKNALNRLGQYDLVVFGRFKAPDKELPSFQKVIHLTAKGSALAKSLGVTHRFNPMELLDAPTAKARAQTSMMVVNFLKHLKQGVEDFKIRPILLNKTAFEDGIVRPAAEITVFGQELYFEVPRRGKADWKEDLCDKLRRYVVVFEKELPCVVLNCENREMSRELFDYLNAHCTEHGFPMENLLFTHDLAQFGDNFESCLYAYDEEGDLVTIDFFDDDCALEDEEQTAFFEGGSSLGAPVAA